MTRIVCFFITHDWRYWNKSRRSYNRCGRTQVRLPYDANHWSDIA